MYFLQRQITIQSERETRRNKNAIVHLFYIESFKWIWKYSKVSLTVRLVQIQIHFNYHLDAPFRYIHVKNVCTEAPIQ